MRVSGPHIVIVAAVLVGAVAVATPADAPNPWGEETVLVSYDTYYTDDNYRADAIREAVEYWNHNAEEYGDYSVKIRLVPDQLDRADIKVTFQGDIDICGLNIGGPTAGCTKKIEADQEVSEDVRPILLKIDGDLDECATEKVLKHEFGHIYGLDHDDEPQPLMNETMVLEDTNKGDC